MQKKNNDTKPTVVTTVPLSDVDQPGRFVQPVQDVRVDPCVEQSALLPGTATTAQIAAVQSNPPTDTNGNPTGPGSKAHQADVKKDVKDKTRVRALTHLVIGDHNYRPGDLIEDLDDATIVHLVDSNAVTIEDV